MPLNLTPVILVEAPSEAVTSNSLLLPAGTVKLAIVFDWLAEAGVPTDVTWAIAVKDRVGKMKNESRMLFTVNRFLKIFIAKILNEIQK